jgi:hypothetical protein
MIGVGSNKDQTMPAEPLSLKELFLAALAVAPAERAAWLAQACGQNLELRGHLEQMLAAHQTAQSLFDRPPRAAGESEKSTPVNENRRERVLQAVSFFRISRNGLRQCGYQSVPSRTPMRQLELEPQGGRAVCRKTDDQFKPSRAGSGHERLAAVPTGICGAP